MNEALKLMFLNDPEVGVLDMKGMSKEEALKALYDHFERICRELEGQSTRAIKWILCCSGEFKAMRRLLYNFFDLTNRQNLKQWIKIREKETI